MSAPSLTVVLTGKAAEDAQRIADAQRVSLEEAVAHALAVRVVRGVAAHGTAVMYRSRGCRCDDCREAHKIDVRERAAERAVRLVEEFDRLPHGNTSTYCNWGCRCEPCRAAQAVKNAAARDRRKAAQS